MGHFPELSLLEEFSIISLGFVLQPSPWLSTISLVPLRFPSLSWRCCPITKGAAVPQSPTREGSPMAGESLARLQSAVAIHGKSPEQDQGLQAEQCMGLGLEEDHCLLRRAQCIPDTRDNSV